MNESILNSEKYIQKIIDERSRFSYHELVSYMNKMEDDIIITIEALMYLGDGGYAEFEAAYTDMKEKYDGKDKEVCHMCGKGNNGDLFISCLKKGYEMVKRC